METNSLKANFSVPSLVTQYFAIISNITGTVSEGFRCPDNQTTPFTAAKWLKIRGFLTDCAKNNT